MFKATMQALVNIKQLKYFSVYCQSTADLNEKAIARLISENTQTLGD